MGIILSPRLEIPVEEFVMGISLQIIPSTSIQRNCTFHEMDGQTNSI